MSVRSRRVFQEIYELALAMVGVAIRPDASTAAADSPRIEACRGAPTAVRVASSIMLRMDGANNNERIYVSDGSTWEAVPFDAGDDAFDDTATYYTTDTIKAAFAALATQIGGASDAAYNFTNGTGTRLTDNDAVYAALNKLDQGFVDLLSTALNKGASLVSINDVGSLITATTVEAALQELATKIAALGAENTDVTIPVDLLNRIDISGTWALSRTGTAAYRLRRAAADLIEIAAFRVCPRSRTTASKGFKPTGVKLVYTVSTADIDDVTVSAAFQVAPATGSAPAAATSLGTVTYDADHDTSAKRKSSSTGGGNHTLVATFGSPVYLADPLIVEILVTVDGSATGVFDIVGLELLGSETITDLA